MSEFAAPALPDNLPDVLALADGTPVTTAETWETRRRPEILATLTREMYGRMPDRPTHISSHVTDEDPAALSGAATRRQITLHLSGRDDGPQIRVLLYLPNAATKPAPVFIGLNFAGNQTVHADPGIHLPAEAGESTRGAAASGWAIETLIARGYALATAHFNDIALDSDTDYAGSGITALFPELATGDDNLSGIGAWAWGMSRLLDYAETDPALDARRAIAFGHSRMGKTALWAAATDLRFALAISNESGAGGAKLFRRHVGEDIARLNRFFPHWFDRRFNTRIGQDKTLPWDQHWTLALIAPRPLYIASAILDLNADPEGEFAGARAADPVYRLLCGDGLPPGDFPAVNEPMLGRIGYHVRDGAHDVTDYDWAQYLNFADRHLRGTAEK